MRFVKILSAAYGFCQPYSRTFGAYDGSIFLELMILKDKQFVEQGLSSVGNIQRVPEVIPDERFSCILDLCIPTF